MNTENDSKQAAEGKRAPGCIEHCTLRAHGPFVYVEFLDGVNELMFDGHAIAHLLPEGDDSATRIARLIAAAPELLAACEEAAQFVDHGEYDRAWGTRVVKTLAAAIRKARGE